MPHKSSSQRLVQPTMDLNDGAASRPEGALCRSLLACISAVIKFGVGAGKDPFANVKELITELINWLESKASSVASHKYSCDDEFLRRKRMFKPRWRRTLPCLKQQLRSPRVLGVRSLIFASGGFGAGLLQFSSRQVPARRLHLPERLIGRVS